MELEDLKSAWQSLDRRLARQESIELLRFRESGHRRLKSSLRPLFWGQCAQIAFGIACIVAGVATWKTLGAAVPFLVAGIIAHVYGVVTVAAAGIVLGQLSRLDTALPVLELQRRLLRLRKLYLISGMAVGLPWWVLWMVPLFAIASYQASLDGASGPPLWLWICLAGGLAGIAATWWFHRWLHRPGRETLARRVEDQAAGKSLRRAQAELDELKRYIAE